jgi:U3 small nucleolar ribonucleoprotein protein IMP4
MLRKQVRQRKEYLHEKEKDSMKKDCEYNEDFYTDPQVLITTSRHPSSRLKMFHKEFSSLIPNSTTVNRGGYQLKEIQEFGIRKGFSDIVLIHENKGEPNGLVISHLPIGPTIYFGISNAILRHDITERKDNVSLAYPHLIFDNFNDNIGQRIKTILKNIFPIPKLDSKRIMSFMAKNDFISLRHHVYEKPDFKTVDLFEVGPRFELKPYMIKLGSITDNNATVEWSIKPYMNTSGKNKQIDLN